MIVLLVDRDHASVFFVQKEVSSGLFPEGTDILYGVLTLKVRYLTGIAALEEASAVAIEDGTIWARSSGYLYVGYLSQRRSLKGHQGDQPRMGSRKHKYAGIYGEILVRISWKQKQRETGTVENPIEDGNVYQVVTHPRIVDTDEVENPHKCIPRCFYEA